MVERNRGVPLPATAGEVAKMDSQVAVREPVDAAEAFATHQTFVWRVLVSAGVPRAEVDDAVQDVFITVHRRRRHYDGRAPLRHWIYGIARGIGRNHARKAARAATRQRRLPPTDLGSPAPPDTFGDDAGSQTSEDQEAFVARTQASEILGRFLATLATPQREVFVLVHIEGLAVPEIADMLGAPVNTVYSRLRLARERFEAMVTRMQTTQTKARRP